MNATHTIARHPVSDLARTLVAAALMLLTSAAQSSASGASESADAASDPPATMEAETFEHAETAVLAGGCFWGVEAVFERLNGVLDVVSGYSGGTAGTARYEIVSTGMTLHAQSVQVVYDPDIISFEILLEVFFRVAHNPTQLNYQGPDLGPQYRSAVFYADEEQKAMTERYIARLAADGVYDDPVVTQVVALDTFHPAEDYHQDFMRRNPNHPYILYWDVPKIERLERSYPELLGGVGGPSAKGLAPE